MHVTATQYELIDGRSDKYYRTYLAYPTADPRSPAALLRQWGRRGSDGQWSIIHDSLTNLETEELRLTDSKENKGYEAVDQPVDFDTPPAVSDSWLAFSSSSNRVPPNVRTALKDAFYAAWVKDFENRHFVYWEETEQPQVYIHIPRWATTAKTRAPAGMLADVYNDRILWRSNTSESVLVQVPQVAFAAVQQAFTIPGSWQPRAAHAGTSISAAFADDGDTDEIIALGLALYDPTSSGPYRTLEGALRDARTISQ